MTRRFHRAICMLMALALCSALVGCGSGGNSEGSAASSGGGQASSSQASAGTTSGPAFEMPAEVKLSPFNREGAFTKDGSVIDVSTAADGYVSASAVNDSRLKLQVLHGSSSYNYDLPNDGTPIAVPLNMGDGMYQVRVMQNTSGSNYVEIASTTVNAAMASEFEPYLRPNLFTDYNASSAVVAKARELAEGAANEGEVLERIYGWIVTNVSYDKDKAAELQNASGYIPNPDVTLASGKGICFDYASLAAAMFRSLGIPCQVMTGYVTPGDLYHSWNRIYIDGRWVTAHITVDPNTWTRIDLTFAASNGDTTGYVGDGTSYTDRYTY